MSSHAFLSDEEKQQQNDMASKPSLCGDFIIKDTNDATGAGRLMPEEIKKKHNSFDLGLYKEHWSSYIYIYIYY